MSTYNHYAYLCGHFTTKKEIRVSDNEWEQTTYSTEKAQEYNKFFYKEFLELQAPYSSKSLCKHYLHKVDKNIGIQINGKNYGFTLKGVKLHAMPFGIVLFSIEIENSSDNLNDFTNILFSLRSLNYDSNEQAEFIKEAIDPIKKIYCQLKDIDECGFSDLVENGNKMKIFQIVNSNINEGLTKEQRLRRLYEIASTSRVTLDGEKNPTGSSDEYIEKITSTNRLSVFKNWDALGLLDSFTIYSTQTEDRLINQWKSSYFELIYLHALFKKVYLFDLNNRFRENSTCVANLEKEYENFEQECCFHKISYNFLPHEILKTINSGLEIDEENKQLGEILVKSNERRKKRNENKVNMLLLGLSALTISSALFDLASLLDQMFPYTNYFEAATYGYRLVITLTVTIVGTITYLLFRKK